MVFLWIRNKMHGKESTCVPDYNRKSTSRFPSVFLKASNILISIAIALKKKRPQDSASEITLRPWGTYFGSTQVVWTGLSSTAFRWQIKQDPRKRNWELVSTPPLQILSVSLCLDLFFSFHVDLGSYSVSNMRCAYHTGSCIYMLGLQLVALLWEVVTMVGGGT